MIIIDMLRTSLIDYPGQVSTVLYNGKCDFRCVYCDNIKNLNKEPLLSYFQIRKILLDRKHLVDHVVLSGCEFILEPDIIPFLIFLKNEGFSVKLDTNGNSPDKLKKIIDKNLLDYVAMDIKAPLEKIRGVTRKHKGLIHYNIVDSIDILKTSNIEHEFRTTVYKDLFNEYHFKQMLDLISDYRLEQKYYIQNISGDRFEKEDLENLLGIIDLGKQYNIKVGFRNF